MHSSLLPKYRGAAPINRAIDALWLSRRRDAIDEVYAGDIAAIVGLKDTFTGDTLCDPEHPIILESMTFPEPVIEVKIERWLAWADWD